MEHNTQFLETEPVGRLMHRYAIPCVISLLVGALYNIVDQIFIANASYLGSYGNAANTVVFPLTVVALAIAVMIGKAILLTNGGGIVIKRDFASVTWRTIDRWEQGSVQIFKSTRERYFKQGLERQKLFR